MNANEILACSVILDIWQEDGLVGVEVSSEIERKILYVDPETNEVVKQIFL